LFSVRKSEINYTKDRTFRFVNVEFPSAHPKCFLRSSRLRWFEPDRAGEMPKRQNARCFDWPALAISKIQPPVEREYKTEASRSEVDGSGASGDEDHCRPSGAPGLFPFADVHDLTSDCQGD
jgi:hypothetical protein